MRKNKNFSQADDELKNLVKQELVQNLMDDDPSLCASEASQRIDDAFVPDGIMSMGEFYIDKVEHVRRKASGKENLLWDEMGCKRVLFLSKELNASDGTDTYDIREDSIRKMAPDKKYVLDIGYHYNKRIAYVLHGLMHLFCQNGNEPLAFDDVINHQDAVLQTLDHCIYARINVKPTGGQSSCEDTAVSHEAQKYKGYLFERIMNLSPKIMICMGVQEGHSFIIEDVLNTSGFNFVPSGVNGVLIDEAKKMIAIKSYHFSCFLTDKEIYDTIVDGVCSFMQIHPEYFIQ